MNPEVSNPPLDEPKPHPIIVEAIPTGSESLGQKLAEQKELNLRLTADFENFKRRSRQETEVRAAAQKESFIQGLLPVLDNLERALASGASPGAPQLRQGVEMTLQQLRTLLRQHGIEAEETVGQPFDPRRHEAIAQRHDAAPAQPRHPRGLPARLPARDEDLSPGQSRRQ